MEVWNDSRHADRHLPRWSDLDLTWTALQNEPVFDNGHDINVLCRDPLRGRYCAFSVINSRGPTWSFSRTIVQRTSTDLIHWSQPWYAMTPNKSVDEGRTGNYSMGASLARGNLWICMVKILRDDLTTDTPPDAPNERGIGYTSLIWSRDGESWVRDPAKFLDRNPQKGTWDHAMSWISEQVLVGDEVYLYYAGYARGHKVNMFEERQIGLLKMKRDRYVAREAGAAEGRLKTRRLSLDANATGMTLNADARNGELKVQVVDASNNPVPGFSFQDCSIPKMDSVSIPVVWKRPLSQLKGQSIRLEFSMKNTKLFAFDVLGSSRSEAVR
jgi:hypothetical protein